MNEGLLGKIQVRTVRWQAKKFCLGPFDRRAHAVFPMAGQTGHNSDIVFLLRRRKEPSEEKQLCEGWFLAPSF